MVINEEKRIFWTHLIWNESMRSCYVNMGVVMFDLNVKYVDESHQLASLSE